MKRDDCEKLLGAYRESVIARNHEAAQMLFEVIVGIMADEKKSMYRDSVISVRDTPPNWADGGYSTIPTHVTKPVITCDCKDEYTEGF